MHQDTKQCEISAAQNQPTPLQHIPVSLKHRVRLSGLYIDP